MALKEMESDLQKLQHALNLVKGNPPNIGSVHEALQILLELFVERIAEEVAIERGG